MEQSFQFQVSLFQLMEQSFQLKELPFQFLQGSTYQFPRRHY